MAKLVFGMNQSLDGYVDHTEFAPSPTLFRHFIEEARGQVHPVVLGHGTPYFAGPRPPLRLVAHERMAEDVIRLIYVPA